MPAVRGDLLRTTTSFRARSPLSSVCAVDVTRRVSDSSPSFAARSRTTFKVLTGCSYRSIIAYKSMEK
jgi:hypothetical protein